MTIQQAKTLDLSSSKDLLNLTNEITEKHPEIIFRLKPDPSGKYIELIAEVKDERLVKTGDMVDWENNGALMWDGPRKIIRIE